MDWGSIVSVITALLVAILLPLALRKRKKAGPQNVEQLFHHLQGIGVRVSLLEKDVEQGKVRGKRSWGQRSEGVIRVEGRNIDCINVASVTSQYGVNYFLDYLVSSPGGTVRKNRKKTRMIRKKSSGLRGRVVDIQWKGDDYLSRQLSFDYELKDRLLQAELDKLKGSIWISPEPKYEYAKVRTAYLLPSSDLFEAIDIIAKYVKSGW